MKKTQRLDLLTTIKGSIVSFFAITMFVALGIGLFLGIHWLAGSMHSMLDTQFAQGNAHHIEITFPYGLTEDDLAQLSKLEGVDEIDAGYLTYQEFTIKGSKAVTRVASLPQSIDIFTEVDGTLPSASDEIAINAPQAKEYDLSIGDTITFLADSSSSAVAKTDAEEELDQQVDAGDDGMKYLNASTYTITAIVKSPQFLVKNNTTYGVATIGSGTIDVLAWVPESAFDASAYRDAKPYVLVRSQALDGLGYSTTEYKEASAKLEARVKDLGAELGNARFNSIYGEAQSAIDEGQAQVDEKTAELEAGREKVEQGEAELESGKAQLEEGEKQLAEGKATMAEKLASAEKQLSDALATITAGREQYNAAASQLNTAKAQLAEGEALYNQATAALSACQAAIDDLRNDLSELRAAFMEGGITEEELIAEVNEACNEVVAVLSSYGITLPFTLDYYTADSFLNDAQSYLNLLRDREFTVSGYTVTLNTAFGVLQQARDQIASSAATLASKYAELTAGEQQYNEALAKYESEKKAAEEKIANAESEIAANKEKLEAGEKELADGKAQIESGEKLLAEAEEKLAVGREQLASLVQYGWVVLPRGYNGAVLYTDAFARITGNMRWSMASLFLIVGILVCYSAVSRLVHEQITRIGTKKAVGFRAGEINALFISYAAMCVIVGAVLGMGVAMGVVEPIILRSMNSRFMFDCTVFFKPLELVLITLLEFVLIIGATWIAVRGVLKMQAVELLAGEKPPSAKARFYEKWGVWQRLGLLAQTTINNCVNDTRRVVGTLVGVAGCTALIVCAMMLNDNVLRSFTRQYDAVYHFDAVATVIAESEAATQAEQLLEDAGMEATEIYQQSLTLEQPDGTRSSVTAIVPIANDEFSDFYTLNPTVATSENTNEGVWISQAYAEHLGAKVGDEVTVTDSTGKYHSWPIAGFFEYHLSAHQMVLSLDTYEEAFGVRPAANRIFIKTQDKSAKDVKSTLGSLDGYVNSWDDRALNEKVFKEFASLSRIMVMVYLALAAVMAACVLLNLDFMFVDEKKRELIVLMINGYSLKDAKGYIWHDSVVLTTLGIICGLVLGNAVGLFTVTSAEQVNTSFMHDISWIAMASGIGGSVVLAFVALTIALRRIGKFELTDINRF